MQRRYGARVALRKAAIRPFDAADEPLLFGLAHQTFSAREGWSDARTLAVLESETVFVAEVDGDVAGFVALAEEDDAAQVDELLVAPAHEGEGVGRQLLDWAEGWAISREARVLRIVVEGDNRAALDFYSRAGFVGAGPDLLERVLPQLA
jgi:ribosomal protein S18 acetylase RimI-like enzyme